MPPHRALAVAAAVAMLGSGCGGAAKGYADRADEICAPVVASFRVKLRASQAGATQSRDLSAQIRERGAALAKLHGLEPPPAKREIVREMLRHFDDSQELLREAERLYGKSERAIGLLVMAAREDAKGQAVARSLGLGACAEF